MNQTLVAVLAGGMLVAAFLYASVGHGGASAYIAALAAGFVGNPALPPDYAWVLMPAVLIGGWAGAEHGSRRFANPVIRRALAAVLAIAGGKLVLV